MTRHAISSPDARTAPERSAAYTAWRKATPPPRRSAQSTGTVADAVRTLADLLDRLQERRDKIPSNLANTATAESLDAVPESRGHVEDRQAVEVPVPLPNGFGRD